MAEAQDVDSLKRRGRRRLVGAVALVLLAVIVLPMVFDPEPRRSAPPVSVKIPGEDDTAFTPKMAKAPEKAEEKTVEPQTAPVEKKAPPVAEKAVERARAEVALAGSGFIIPVGAFTNPDPVIAKIAGAKLPYFTESIAAGKGTVTRVRAGPFPSKESADKALETLKGLGFKPGNVTAKS